MVGKSVPTVTRAIKRGDLTATKLERGGYEIDVSELTRVFDAVTPESDTKPNTLGHETASETRVLEVKLEASEALNQRLLDELADMKEQRNKWQAAADRLLLTSNQNTAQEAHKAPSSGLFGFLRGKGAA